jgi:hypothetical protein
MESVSRNIWEEGEPKVEQLETRSSQTQWKSLGMKQESQYLESIEWVQGKPGSGDQGW